MMKILKLAPILSCILVCIASAFTVSAEREFSCVVVTALADLTSLEGAESADGNIAWIDTVNSGEGVILLREISEFDDNGRASYRYILEAHQDGEMKYWLPLYAPWKTAQDTFKFSVVDDVTGINFIKVQPGIIYLHFKGMPDDYTLVELDDGSFQFTYMTIPYDNEDVLEKSIFDSLSEEVSVLFDFTKAN